MTRHSPLTPPANFDEEKYLRLNPDVADAVRMGNCPSGWSHYLNNGVRERRSGVPDALVHELELEWYATQEVDIPRVPPARLRARVHGDPVYQTFDEVGARNVRDLERAFDRFGIVIPDAGKVLDFGCGCGRILRHLAPAHPSWQFFGTDIDDEAVSWSQHNLSSLARFDTNDHWPPSRYRDRGFDLVFAISVFTHLPETMQTAWLNELARITKPDGWILITSQVVQDTYMQRGPESGSDGFRFVVAGTTEGLPDFYQLASIDHSYIRSKWSSRLEVVDILPQFINQHQDLVVCRSRGSPLLP